MWAEFVVGSLPCSEMFFSGYTGSSLPLKHQPFQIPIRSGTNEFLTNSLVLQGQTRTQSLLMCFGDVYFSTGYESASW